jgi:hypothetical protein
MLRYKIHQLLGGYVPSGIPFELELFSTFMDGIYRPVSEDEIVPHLEKLTIILPGETRVIKKGYIGGPGREPCFKARLPGIQVEEWCHKIYSPTYSPEPSTTRVQLTGDELILTMVQYLQKHPDLQVHRVIFESDDNYSTEFREISLGYRNTLSSHTLRLLSEIPMRELEFVSRTYVMYVIHLVPLFERGILEYLHLGGDLRLPMDPLYQGHGIRVEETSRKAFIESVGRNTSLKTIDLSGLKGYLPKWELALISPSVRKVVLDIDFSSLLAGNFSLFLDALVDHTSLIELHLHSQGMITDNLTALGRSIQINHSLCRLFLKHISDYRPTTRTYTEFFRSLMERGIPLEVLSVKNETDYVTETSRESFKALLSSPSCPQKVVYQRLYTHNPMRHLFVAMMDALEEGSFLNEMDVSSVSAGSSSFNPSDEETYALLVASLQVQPLRRVRRALVEVAQNPEEMLQTILTEVPESAPEARYVAFSLVGGGVLTASLATLPFAECM